MASRRGQPFVEVCDIPEIVEMAQDPNCELEHWGKEDIEDLEKELKKMHEVVSGLIKSISDSPSYGKHIFYYLFIITQLLTFIF